MTNGEAPPSGSAGEKLLTTLSDGDEDSARAQVAGDPQLAALRARGAPLVRLAAYAHMWDLVSDLVDGGIELDVFDAAALGQVERLEQLLDAHTDDRDAVSEDGFTPLHLAAFFGQVKACELILNRGAAHDPVSANQLAVQPINSAAANAHDVIVHLLLDHGADPDATMSGGFRPLHAAAHNGRLSMVRLLLDRGADPNARNDDGQLPADLADDQEILAALSGS